MLNYWPIRYSHKSVLLAVLVSTGISLLYIRYIMPLGMLITGLVIIILFFYGLQYFSERWKSIPLLLFEKYLYIYSTFFRLIFVAFLYLHTYYFDNASYPFEIGAADSWTYDIAADKLANTSFGNYFHVLPSLMKNASDYGYPIYQSIIYKVFGHYTLPVRLLNCLLGSFTVLYLSRTARYLYGEKQARLTAVISMIFPSLLWFAAMQMKETLMIFLIISTFYHAVKIYCTKKLFIHSVIVIILFSFFLFYFRTFLAVLVIMSILAYFILNIIRKLTIRKVIIMLFIFYGSIFLINSYGFFTDINQTYSKGQESGFFSKNIQSESERLGNIDFREAAVTPFIIAGSIITPFPSFLYTEERQLPIIAHFQNEIVRNFMYFFAILGFITLIIKNFRKSSLFLLFILGYLYVITTAGNSFQDRFHLLLVPFLIIGMSVGLVNSSRKWLQHWNWYLVLIVVAQIAWTIFKLNIRGI